MISRFRSATALASLTLFSAPAFAQASPNVQNPAQAEAATPAETSEQASNEVSADGQEPRGNEVVVTGSRIPRPETSGVLPGVQVNAEQILSRGFTSAAEVLNDIPLVGPSGANVNGAAPGQATSIGNAFVDLLDLGTSRTLTLVNGRRFVSGNQASLFVADNAPGGQVDVNVIPVALIDRVDVLTVGGAAAYGADAIAGVVNYVLKDNYDGTNLTAVSGTTSRGDGAQYTLRATHGQNTKDGANIVFSGEYNRIEGVQASQRDFRNSNPGFITSFLNGASRNSAFAPALPISQAASNNGAFLRAADDGVPSNITVNNASSLILSAGGNVFQLQSAVTGSVNQVGPAATAFVASSVTQLIPGTPFGNGLNGAAAAAGGLTFTNFAPASLPGANVAAQAANAQAILTQFAPNFVAQGTQAERNTLALNLLQANRPTLREFYAANPTVPLNYFLGTTVPGYLDVANTDTRLVTIAGRQVPVNQLFPRVAVPLRFNAQGNLETFSQGAFDPATGSTLGSSVNADGLNTNRFTALRVQQDRYIANIIGSVPVTDEIKYFFENLYARVNNTSRYNPASSNTAGGNAVETGGLIVNTNNPYLDAADRATLAAAGLGPNTNFILSRTNQDIFGDYAITNNSRTFRTVNGLRTSSTIFGRTINAEISGTYGYARQVTRTKSIKDVEYNLAIDTVVDSTGAIRCRSQVQPGVGVNASAIDRNIIKQPGADGIPTFSFFQPTATAAQIAACQPLNPFGINQMSQAAKDYVLGTITTTNVARQLFFQATVGGNIFDLPAGPLGFSANTEYRQEKLRLSGDPAAQLGQLRNAPTLTSIGETRTFETGIEARIPITGGDFTLPVVGEIVFSPAVRIVQQSGDGEPFRDFSGLVNDQKARGEAQTIWTLAATWAPIRDILFRGNITRSIRQPSITELFLGGQQAFQGRNDVCSNTLISQGTNAASRRANCAADVVRLGIRGDTTSALDFLNTFVADTANLQGVFSGSTALQPEKGKSRTAGVVLTPRFLPGFSASADYIEVDLGNQIVPIGIFQSNQFCYDSTTYPDTTPQFGSNLCTTFSRSPTNFQLQNGFVGGFLNQGATELRALNISGRYGLRLPANIGNITLRGNAYHLIRYDDSNSGNFSDRLRSAGTFNRPKWEVQTGLRYDKSSFFTQLTWNWRQKTQLFSAGAPATVELVPNIQYPATSLFDLALGASAAAVRFQLVVQNLTDKNYAGDLGFFNAAYLDQIGRRFQMTASIDF